MAKNLCEKNVAFFVCCVILFALLFSVGFMAWNADHECSGCHCSICQAVAACEKILTAVLRLTAIVVSSFLAVLSFYLAAEEKKAEFCHHTPVCNKVKLSD